MTISELCNNQNYCRTCLFHDACELLDVNAPFGFDEGDDNLITRSIIETAKLLQEDKNND